MALLEVSKEGGENPASSLPQCATDHLRTGAAGRPGRHPGGASSSRSIFFTTSQVSETRTNFPSLVWMMQLPFM